MLRRFIHFHIRPFALCTRWFVWKRFCVLSPNKLLPAPATSEAALPELLEAAEEKKLRSAVAGRSALLQLVGGSTLSELLGPAEAGRFMAALRKMQS